MNVELSTEYAAIESSECLRRCGAGDREALQELTRRYGSAVNGMLYQILADAGAAEAASVDGFARVWRDAKRYDGREPVRLFLYRHAVKAAVHDASRFRTRVGAGATAARGGLALALQVLEIGDRIPLVLYYSERLDAGEIGRVLGRPRFWINLRLMEARRNLREVGGLFVNTQAGAV